MAAFLVPVPGPWAPSCCRIASNAAGVQVSPKSMVRATACWEVGTRSRTDRLRWVVGGLAGPAVAEATGRAGAAVAGPTLAGGEGEGSGGDHQQQRQRSAKGCPAAAYHCFALPLLG